LGGSYEIHSISGERNVSYNFQSGLFSTYKTNNIGFGNYHPSIYLHFSRLC